MDHEVIGCFHHTPCVLARDVLQKAGLLALRILDQPDAQAFFKPLLQPIEFGHIAGMLFVLHAEKPVLFHIVGANIYNLEFGHAVNYFPVSSAKRCSTALALSSLPDSRRKLA